MLSKCWLLGLAVGLPGLSGYAQKVVELTPKWSVPSAPNVEGGMNAMSGFESTRRVAFAADRVVVSVDAGPASAVDGKLSTTVRLVSLDVTTGAVRNEKSFAATGAPLVFANDHDEVVVDIRIWNCSVPT